MPQDNVVSAYGARAQSLALMLGTEVYAGDPDLAVVEPWAASLSGKILDVGSGTGRWSGHLAGLGHDVEGLEPAEELVQVAREAHPSVPFRHASIADLDGSREHPGKKWAGILAWYSLIHLTPDELTAALDTLYHALDEGGSMLVSFFTGPDVALIEHPVAPAYRWPVDYMGDSLTHAGFTVEWPGTNLLSNNPHALNGAVVALK